MNAFQKQVIAFTAQHGKIKNADAAKFKGFIYANAAKYVSESLGRMVKAGMLIRENPGVYVLPTEPKPYSKEQLNLFQQ